MFTLDLMTPSFSVFALGSGGGPLETNLSSYVTFFHQAWLSEWSSSCPVIYANRTTRHGKETYLHSRLVSACFYKYLCELHRILN